MTDRKTVIGRMNIHKRADRQTDRQTDKQTDKQTDRQTDRQTDNLSDTKLSRWKKGNEEEQIIL